MILLLNLKLELEFFLPSLLGSNFCRFNGFVPKSNVYASLFKAHRLLFLDQDIKKLIKI